MSSRRKQGKARDVLRVQLLAQWLSWLACSRDAQIGQGQGSGCLALILSADSHLFSYVEILVCRKCPAVWLPGLFWIRTHFKQIQQTQNHLGVPNGCCKETEVRKGKRRQGSAREQEIKRRSVFL
ncbi:hypothetical protein BaRGS_00012918 [Batillaria attramentaria]|uniref:Secreted protein n=1 Tax=Batillaria attramentaria TaxID=370345 RepID=A0ABD0L9Q9_9CAEN